MSGGGRPRRRRNVQLTGPDAELDPEELREKAQRIQREVQGMPNGKARSGRIRYVKALNAAAKVKSERSRSSDP